MIDFLSHDGLGVADLIRRREIAPREAVSASIARIEASPFIPRKDSVRGFVYDVETGRLREVS